MCIVCACVHGKTLRPRTLLNAVLFGGGVHGITPSEVYQIIYGASKSFHSPASAVSLLTASSAPMNFQSSQEVL